MNSPQSIRREIDDALDRANATTVDGAALGAVRDTRTAIGDDGTEAILKKCKAFVENSAATKRQNKAIDTLRRAINALNKDQLRDCCRLALDAIELNPDFAQAHLVLAAALEQLGQLHLALQQYEQALKLDPTDPDVYLNIGLVAWRMNMLDTAEKIFRINLQVAPDSMEALNNLAGVLRDKGDFENAVEILRATIYANPESAVLWNTLGTVMVEQFDYDTAFTFYNEALRLQPDYGRAFHNMGYAYAMAGPYEKAIEYLSKAVELAASRSDEITSRHDLSLSLLGVGKLEEGWAEYEARLNPLHPKATIFPINAPLWRGESLEGKHILLIGEQGLGDEIMFANPFPEIIEQVGPDGAVSIACEHRLVPLFARSFPQAHVGPHASGTSNGKIVRIAPWIDERPPVDFFAPFASALRHTRKSVEDFPSEGVRFTPDPDRVAYWRSKLEALGPGPYVGVAWRSMLMDAQRSKFFSPFDKWRYVFENEHLQFVNIQYGDVATDIERARNEFGARIWEPDGIDIRNDLDDNAALCAALDLVVCPQNAAMNLAACVGAPVWVVAASSSWPRFGTDRLPWYPNVKVHFPEKLGEWDPVMRRLGAALAAFHPPEKKSRAA